MMPSSQAVWATGPSVLNCCNQAPDRRLGFDCFDTESMSMRKDVAAKGYSVVIARKRDLLEKQKEGKKMRPFGTVDIPQEVLIAALKVDS